jgi:Core-2/I-Branching enzyme
MALALLPMLLRWVWSEEASSIMECDCENYAPATATTADSSAPSMARIAYLITVHNARTADDAVHLFRAIRSPHNMVVLHVDRKFDSYASSLLHAHVTTCPCGATVVVDSVHSAEWSTWSMNEPTFWGMQVALTNRADWDVFINLSGDTMPVYTPNVIGGLFHGPLAGYNFVTSSSCETGLQPTSVYHFPPHWHKRGHYTSNPEGNPVIDYVDDRGNEQSVTLTIHFGSQWMALQPDFCQYLIDSLQRPDSLPSRFKDYLVQTERLMTDETFIPTLLMHVMPFNTTLPNTNHEGAMVGLEHMTALRFERMDEHVPTAFGYYPTRQRYEVPASSGVDAPKPWGPYFLGVYDLASIIDSGALYIRKVSASIDPNLVALLPVSNTSELPYIEWPTEVQVSPVPNWQKKLEEYRKAYKMKLENSAEEDDQDL